ncbi:MAG: hypothetical protein UZ15_CFX003001688 [Chloroflexi bacterium OLB15]|nr:MAG: hypothetical protein UZ15_CFX003001688 [Chloroflexi bacterium OLB15]
MSTEAQADVIVSLLTYAVVAFIIFLILRELVCWYWKINEMITLQKRIITLLETLTKDTSQLNQLNHLSDIAESLAPHKPQSPYGRPPH